MIRLAVLGAIIAASFGGGFLSGKGWCEGVHAKQDRAILIEQNRREAARQIREAERDAAARELEDQAFAQPITNDCGLPADRVRRLNLR